LDRKSAIIGARSSRLHEICGSAQILRKKYDIQGSKCGHALAISAAQHRNVAPTICVGTLGPSYINGDTETGHGRGASVHFSRPASDGREKYGLSKG
jgi:hypothetical protein